MEAVRKVGAKYGAIVGAWHYYEVVVLVSEILWDSGLWEGFSPSPPKPVSEWELRKTY